MGGAEVPKDRVRDVTVEHFTGPALPVGEGPAEVVEHPFARVRLEESHARRRSAGALIEGDDERLATLERPEEQKDERDRERDDAEPHGARDDREHACLRSDRDDVAEPDGEERRRREVRRGEEVGRGGLELAPQRVEHEAEADDEPGDPDAEDEDEHDGCVRPEELLAIFAPERQVAPAWPRETDDEIRRARAGGRPWHDDGLEDVVQDPDHEDRAAGELDGLDHGAGGTSTRRSSAPAAPARREISRSSTIIAALPSSSVPPFSFAALTAALPCTTNR